MRQPSVDVVRVCFLAGLNLLTLVPEALAQTLPSPWLTQDIGSPSPAGTASFSNQQFSIAGSGSDIWGTSDQFRFVYQQVTGDVEIVARISSFSAVDPWSKVGVMVRNDLTASSAHAFSMLSGANGSQFQNRPQPSAYSATTAGPLISAPQWVRLRRVGSTLTASTGTDGATWQTIGSVTITLNASVYVGMAITSHKPSSLASAVVSNVVVSPLTSVITSPGGLPSGQSAADIGSPKRAGSSIYNSGTYTITAAGADIWGSSDQFRFVYQQITGDVDVIARVNSIMSVSARSMAGVMVRETLDAGARHAMTLISAGNGYSFQWRLDPGGLAGSSSGGSGVAPGWVRLKRTGYQFDAYRSPDGRSWTWIGRETVPMAASIYVGLAVTSGKQAVTTTALIDQLKVTSSTINQPPTVTLTSPTSGSSYVVSATVTLSASASDPEGRLSRVEFYVGSTLVTADTVAPFSTSWSTSTAGTYAIKAIAYDADGAATTSAISTVTIASLSSTTNRPPTVTLTSPTSGQSFKAPATVTLSASASDPEGHLSRVEFYVGSTLLATDNSSPFSATWYTSTAGSYSFRAIAYDADGGSATSAISTITVTSSTSSVPTKVIFQASPDHATLVTSYRLDVFANGASPGSSTPVASSNLGKPAPDVNNDITVDRATFFSALAPATYIATVSAIGSAGESRSAAITFVR